MKKSILTLLMATMTGATLCSPALAADDYPSKPIRIVVPYPAGSALEGVARTASQSYSESLGQSAIIVNMPGASGMIGTQDVARAQADGYTLLLGTNQTHGANAALYPDIRYDAIKDFQPVAGLARLQHVLVVRKELGVENVAQLLERITGPSAEELNLGSSGNGSASHLVAEMFKQSTGAQMMHIPYKGSGEVAQALIGGFVDISFATLPSVLPFINDGRLVALGVASDSRTTQLPELPTLAEAGVKGVSADAWTALFAPAGTPASVIALLEKVTMEAFNDPEIVEKIAATGFAPQLSTSADVSAFLTEDMKRWRDVIETAGVKLE